MNTFTRQKILVGITGGIAAYKTAELVRRLREREAAVQVVMTKAAQAFITPTTLQALSGRPVRDDLWDKQAEAAMGHIELARWADWLVIAPASADFIARLAHGFANDLLTTLCLATCSPILIAPAMNQQMWANPATQHNLALLQARHIHCIGPASGAQACGEMGPGRMVEPQEIMDYLLQQATPPLLAGKTVVITAGPTQENIDPVRYISNRSSGKMGYALAAAARAAGARVILISGPVNLATPVGVTRINVQTAEQMLQAALDACQACDIFIAAAAVADYRCQQAEQQKIKKARSTFSLTLAPTPDIVATIAQLPKPPFTVGFAAETNNLLDYAKQKLQQKRLHLIIANEVGEQRGFEVDDNAVTLIWPTGQQQLPLAPKTMLARQIISIVTEQFNAHLAAQ